MENNKLLTLLGFAQKAGKLASGDETCEISLKKRKAKLILIAADAAENTRDKWTHLAASHGVPLYMGIGREPLSRAIGKANRTVVAVLDAGFAVQMRKLIGESGTDKGEEPGGDDIDKGKDLSTRQGTGRIE